MNPARPHLIPGALFTDARGALACVNALDLAEMRRFYVLTHPEITAIRGWNGHRQERKWMTCLRGRFAIGLVKLDSFTAPSPHLPAEIFRLEAAQPQTLAIPAGYANAIKALEPDSLLLVLSDKTLDEARDDNWKYPPTQWVDWSQIL